MIVNKTYNNKTNNNEHKNRKIKLQKIKKNGFIFPNDFVQNISIKNIYQEFSKYTNQQLNNINKEIYIAGRIIQQRIMGKAGFITLKNMDQEIQIYITQNKISLTVYNEIFKKLDIGDIISVIGIIFKTKTQQLSIYCTKINLLSKSLKPLPEKFHGLSNKEIKYRKRYLDLISNTKTMKRFIKRSTILMIIRNFMNKNQFLEVETPMMQNIPGGANAKPFITHHNTLNVNMYLRVSPELYLKRLIIGGFNKIYEINRNFRNEGISPKHNPEFTMMELYITYATYKDLMKLIIDLLKYILNKINQSYTIQYQKYQINFNKSFQKFTIKEAILHYNHDITIEHLNNIQKIKNIAKLKNISIQENWEKEKIITKIFENTTEHKLIQPTFITEYPIQVSPLARRNNNNKNIADRFEFFIGGIEIGNGFSELNDPEDQKKRFLKQKKIYTSKNYKMFYDEEYIEAMEYGMPPTAGLGIGIDRLIMILTNTKNIRDIILFPTLKPHTK